MGRAFRGDRSLLPLFVSAGVSDVRLARHYGVNERTVLRWRQAAGLPTALPTGPGPRGEHGTLNRYRRHHCRCLLCRAANARHASTGYARRIARNALNLPTSDAIGSSGAGTAGRGTGGGAAPVGGAAPGTPVAYITPENLEVTWSA